MKWSTYIWDEGTIGAHVWNSFSAQIPVQKSSNHYHTQIARTYSCPKTFQSARESAPPEFWYGNLRIIIVHLFIMLEDNTSNPNNCDEAQNFIREHETF